MFFNYSLIIDPIVLKKYGFVFDIGWGFKHSAVVSEKNDPDFDQKIYEVKNIISNIKNHYFQH